MARNASLTSPDWGFFFAKCSENKRVAHLRQLSPMYTDLASLFARPIAHRGLHACGKPGPIENSLSAAEAAIARGYGIECDIQLTADGDAVVFHDDELDRLTGSRGPTAALTAQQLGGIKLKGSQDRIPTLAAFLDAVRGRATLVIEIKRQAPGEMRLADRALTLVRAYPGPVVLESFDPTVVRHCRAKGSPCPIGLVGPPEDGSAPDSEALDAGDFVSWNIEHLADIAALRPNLPRTTWTVRSQAQADRARSLGAQIVFEGFVPATAR